MSDPRDDEPEVDDSTVRIPRDDVDDDTDVSRRTRRRALDEVAPATPPEASDAPGPRRTANPVDESAPGEPEPEDGSTVVARQESRRRAARGVEAKASPDRIAATSAADLPANGRIAQAPDTVRASYAPRPPQSASITRRPPATRDPQPLADTAAGEAVARRRARRRTAITVVLASLVLVAAVAVLVALFTTTG
ncbi:hypothetical protein ACH3VR_17515 [Microbacterium sp. B2969]|uniref:Uncharacterized protein n=1 Tax=Microbacterium alkaliflavum TaxID=3248839 RepID=A0ABW7QCR8_9MICO